MSREIQPLTQKIGVLSLIYMRGIHQGRQLKLTSQKATLLLTTLYNCLLSSDMLFEMEHQGMTFSGEPAEMVSRLHHIIVALSLCQSIKVIVYSYLILKKMNERITDS